MKSPERWRPVFAVARGVLLLAAVAPPLFADDTEIVAGSRRRVLDSQEIDLGDHSVILNRVETPVLKPTPTPTPAATPQAASAEDLQQAAVPQVFLSLSCSVFDHAVTEVRWQREEGAYVIWSSADFNLLRGEFDFEADGTSYQLMLGIGNESRVEIEQRNAEVAPEAGRTVPDMGASDGAASRYKIVSAPKGGISAEVTRAMDALHRYYDANHERLAREYAEGEAARIAHEKWVQEHPPVPQDTTINYFPIKSAYGEAAVKGETK
jgi:hypothetical protein